MTNRAVLALVCVLFVVRLPSLVEPMGADQGLYAYVGERILAGGVPYVDAWDQKPPAIHLIYGAMRAAWPHDSMVAAADLLVAMGVAWLLYALGASLVSVAVGQTAAVVFLLLSNPAFLRLSGVAVRAQCETFIAAAVTAGLLLIAPPGGPSRPGKASRADRLPLWRVMAAGTLFGVAFTFKYNAAVYVFVGLFGLWLWNRLSVRSFVALSCGFWVPVIAVGAWLFTRGALGDLYEATITYNVRYSGETYAGLLHAVTYLVTFPVRHARVDGLWLLGGAGCAVLIAAAIWKRDRLLPVAWVAAACVSIAINGSRDLPQYFVQAAPALALAAAWGASILWTRSRIVNALAVLVLAFGVWRVNDFTKLAGNTWHDARYTAGRMDRTEYLARYGDRTVRKYSALAIAELSDFITARTPADRPIYIFGFSCGAYVQSARASASRFAWSRPIIAGFNDGRPGYGVAGLLDDLRRSEPSLVALQIRDWAPDVDDSAHFFQTTPPLAEWLRTSYDQVDGPDGFDTWIRRGGAR